MSFLWCRSYSYSMLTTPICTALIICPFFHSIPIASITDTFYIKTFFNSMNCLWKIMFFHIFLIFGTLIWIPIICIRITFTTMLTSCTRTSMPFPKIIVLVSIFCQGIKINLMHICWICIIMILTMSMCIQSCQHCPSGRSTQRRSTIGICKFHSF